MEYATQIFEQIQKLSAKDWINIAISLGALLGTFVTAIATIFLWRVTRILASETTRMVDASSQPHIVATLDANPWSIRHFDLKVENTGHGAAYDISVSFDPPLENGEARKGDIQVPLTKISVLKPRQCQSSYISDYESIQEKIFNVTISWKRSQSADIIEENSYTLDMRDHKNVTNLGVNDPLIQVANSVKKMTEDWSPVAKGMKKIKTDIYTSGDRLHEKRMYERVRRKINKS